MSRVVRANNSNVDRIDPTHRNPRSLANCAWHDRLADRLPAIAAEWAAFIDAGGQLPHIEDVLGEDQGNTGPWRVGILVADGGTTVLGRNHFATTVSALSGVPGLRAALLSVLDAGTELAEHCGPNAGVLRYHLGIDCPTGSALRVGEIETPYVTGAGVLFDDTVPHAAWNHATAPRVTLFCEIDRPLPAAGAARNRLAQRLISMDPRRRSTRPLADEWHAALNPRLWRHARGADRVAP